MAKKQQHCSWADNKRDILFQKATPVLVVTVVAIQIPELLITTLPTSLNVTEMLTICNKKH